MKSICVFCGSSTGGNPEYREIAIRLGKMFAEKQYTLVYGGGNVGLMGIIADSVLESGGKCIGIMPHSIARLEIVHTGLTQLYLVDSFHERKALMADLSDAFIAMPGGFGTLDELTEILTFNQLRISDKPIGLLNTRGYFDHLLRFFDHCVRERFLRDEHRDNLIFDKDPAGLLQKMISYKPLHIHKWIQDIKEEKSIQ